MSARAQLPWLTRPPADFRARVKAAALRDTDALDALAQLARHGLDLNQLHSLARSREAVRARGGAGASSLNALKLGVLSNATTKLLAPCLAATGLRHGLDIEVVEGEFDQVYRESIDPASLIRSGNPEVLLIALDHRGIAGLAEEMTEDESQAVATAIGFVESLCAAFRDSDIQLMLQTVPSPPEPLFGDADARISGSRQRRIAAFNAALSERASAWNCLLLDTASLANAVGRDQWFDAAQWHVAKLSFSQNLVPLFADHCVRLLALARGRIRKVLVLDLDNTLWGGVIGDDGLEGIVLGQGSPQGEAFLGMQRLALALRERGVILAVCSKNDEEIARQPFRDHPDMLLRENHIAVFVANWRDKASNLEAIARALNLGLDALVLVDDNPAEREQVREALPMVAVPELPDDPAGYAWTLAASGLFDTQTFSRDDGLRSEQYQANARREVESSKFRNLDDYLRSLGMRISFQPFDDMGRSRIAQLIARSNQFNLTTRRYTEAQVEAWAKDAGALTLQVRLTDKFGDNGMISVVICRIQGSECEIDTWLMSCRVLNRRVEEAVLAELVRHARDKGVRVLIGCYIPSDRNSLVKDHYRKLGFEAAGSTAQGERWELRLDGYAPPQLPFDVARAVAESE